MTDRWANSGGLDLHVVVDRGGRRVAASLEAALREAVRHGRLPPGATLPPTRTLAVDLGIARNTVATVYGRLVAEGWLVARQGSRTRVAEGPHLAVGAGRPPAAPTRPSVLHDLRAGFPDPTSFPVRWWTAATREVLLADPGAALGYSPPAGSPQLRDALARYLARVRGVNAQADRLVITPGFTSGLRTLADVLRARGVRAVGVEAYGHAAHRHALRDAGLQVVALTVDAHGAVPDLPDGVGAVVLTAAHQFPLGMALSPSRRASFVRWAQATGGVIVEDDYDGEFRYDRRAIGAVQPHAPEHVVYAGTASKTLAPGVGLGWLAAPEHLTADIVEAQEARGASPPLLQQVVLARLVDHGHFDRHVRRMRAHYRGRRAEVARALAGWQGLDVTGLDAGLHVVVELPPRLAEADVVGLCRRRRLALEGLRSFAAASADRPPAIVVGYGTPPGVDYVRAVEALRSALASLEA